MRSRRRASAKPRRDGLNLLEVRDVAKRFGGIEALAGVNLTLAPGELSCIIGPNGCGKTTLFNVVTGAFSPSAGTVHYRGRDITGLPPHRIARLGIARKFQVPGIYAGLSVLENLEIPLAARASGPLRLLCQRIATGRIAVAARPLRPRRSRQANRRQPAPRPQAVAGDRDAARRQRRDAVAGRADRRHVGDRNRRHGATHPRPAR